MNRGGSCIDSPNWIKKKVTVNSKNNDNKCFQYLVRFALNHEKNIYINKIRKNIKQLNP